MSKDNHLVPGIREVAHLWALAAFAVAQPIFAVLRESPEFFVVRRLGASHLVLFTAALVLIPLPAALLPVAVGRLCPLWGRRSQVFLVGILGGLILMAPLSRFTPAPWPLVVFLSAAAGAGAAALYAGSVRIRTLVTMAWPAPLAFAAVFLFTAPVVSLVLPQAEAAEAVSGGADAPVVFVVFDEFPVTSLLGPDGGINRARFPNFAAFADRSTWYPSTIANADSTLVMLPAILTGKAPAPDTLPTTANHPNSLFTLLAASHEMNVVEPFTLLCPEGVCRRRDSRGGGTKVLSLLQASRDLYPRILLPQRYEGDSPSATDLFGEFLVAEDESVRRMTEDQFDTRKKAERERQRHADQAAVMRGFVSSIGAGRALSFIHVYLPHYPYKYLPSGHSYGLLGLPGRTGERWEEPYLVMQGYQRHLLQLRFLDTLVGELMAHLESTETFDRALVVLMADHGVSYRMGEETRKATDGNIGDVAMVPLFIKAPGQKQGGVVHHETVRSTQVLSLVAEALGVEVPWENDPKAEGREFWVRSSRGNEVLLRDPDALRLRGARRLAAFFGNGGSGVDLFAFGPHSEIVGRPVAELPRGQAAGSAEIEDIERYDAVDLDSGEIPAYVRGPISGAALDGEVAIVLNGVVATVVPPYASNGRAARFSALLPPHLFRDGANSIEIYAVDGSGSERVLRLLTGG